MDRTFGIVVALALVAVMAFGVQRTDAAVTEAQAEAAAERGANWFAAEQETTGALSGDWGMTALAATGTNAADVRAGLVDPSAQDFYDDEYGTTGLGGAATDSERAILAGSAGGIQTSRASVSRNMVAQVASFWDGTQVGATGLLNDDIFAALALDRVGAPQSMLDEIAHYVRGKQLPEGGWSWSNSPSATPETDMTGAAVAVLCETGADPQTDPAIQRAFAYLHTVQDDATGGFAVPPWTPVNTDSTGWVASGLIACGINPQSPEWTTADGKTPFDYLLEMQKPDGRFCWDNFTTCEGSAAYATWDSVRPLAGDTWSAEPPEREVASEPAVRPAPSVAAGTIVPIALTIDYGNGESDMCKIEVPADGDLKAALEAAPATAEPQGCVTESDISSAADGESLEQLNGVVPAAGSRWLVSVGGGPEEAATEEPIAFGDMLSLRLEGEAVQPIHPPTLEPKGTGETTATRQQIEPRARLSAARRASFKGGKVLARVSCPDGLGPEGCVGTVTIRYRQGGKVWTGGQAAFALNSGASRQVSVRVRPRLAKLVEKTGRRSVSLVAMTQSSMGAEAFEHSTIRLVSRPHGR
ncbi:MAG TPA: prenyltransferase/squalene oxidase repeat-containing protein [Solirubrobacterales bacterium]|nr:prenyltransferase/squalene oxidase repeat-containing protein [Solirubrobacterales bacterium]